MLVIGTEQFLQTMQCNTNTHRGITDSGHFRYDIRAFTSYKLLAKGTCKYSAPWVL